MSMNIFRLQHNFHSLCLQAWAQKLPLDNCPMDLKGLITLRDI